MESLPPLPDSPTWFRRALAVPCTDEHVEVDGAAIHYLAWGERGRRGLVFVHGGGAHAHWWTHVAATFAEQYRVVAVDLSGHGDSEHRERYDMETWTDEVMAAATDAGIAGRPVIVGHSMGGFVTIATAARHCDDLDGVIVVDSPVREEDPEVRSALDSENFGAPPRTYPTLEDGLARFRTIPEQEHYLPFVMDHVGRRSLRQVDGGFRWKFDRRVFEQFHSRIRATGLPYLAQVRCRFALLRAEHGLVTPDIGAAMYDALGRVAPVIELPEAGHHPMLDVPLVLLTAIRTLLADWDHSEPFRRT